jgi:hypothetical protein
MSLISSENTRLHYAKPSTHEDIQAVWRSARSTTDFNPLKTNGRLFYWKTQLVPRSKHFSSRL